MKKIKVGYLYDFKEGQDYMNDAVYHGLVDSGMFDVYEYGNPYYMLKSFSMESIYGRGFTMFGKLDHTPNVEDHETMKEKIRKKFYDIIIYGCAYKGDHPFKELVASTYSKKEVHVIDGCDWTENFAISKGFDSFATVWKTSLTSFAYGNPIQFAIPESQLIDHIPNKEKLFSLYDPRSSGSYIYKNEKDYYNDYATSYYGVVIQRSQWNTMRVLEVLANRCIPYFIGIENLPATMMVKFPRELLSEVNKYASKNEVHPAYNEIAEELFHFTKSNLTTKELIKIFLI